MPFVPIIRQLRDTVSPVVLFFLLGADLAFLLLHFLAKTFSWSSTELLMSTDRGYSEVFQYIKEYWIAMGLFAVWWRKRAAIYILWALLFVYLLFDDSVSIHERLGGIVASRWNYLPLLGLRTQDFGELTVSAAVGLIFLAPMAYFHVRSGIEAKNVSKTLALILGLLVFFGIFVDMVHILMEHVGMKGMTMFEELGEMIAMSLGVGYVMGLTQRTVRWTLPFSGVTANAAEEGRQTSPGEGNGR